MNIGIYIINSKDKMLNAKLVTQKINSTDLKKKKKNHYLQVFIIIFKGQLRETERGRSKER